MNSRIPRAEPSLPTALSSAQRSAPTQGPSLERLPARNHASVQHRDILRDEERPLRLKDIAAETNVSEKTVRRWIDLRGLPSKKMGGLRIVLKCDLLAFLNQQPATRSPQPAPLHPISRFLVLRFLYYCLKILPPPFGRDVINELFLGNLILTDPFVNYVLNYFFRHLEFDRLHLHLPSTRVRRDLPHSLRKQGSHFAGTIRR